MGKVIFGSSTLAPALSGRVFDLDDPQAGRITCYEAGDSSQTDRAPMLLVHSVNAAASAYEIRPLYDHYSKSRAVYALDLPGFGLSDRSDREYSPRLMTDAVHALIREIRRRHNGVPIDGSALSLGSEFLARAASEDPAAFRSISLVSPTGFNGTGRFDGPPESTRAVPGLHAILAFPLWSGGLFRLLTRPSVVRYFLERTWGGKEIDEGVWDYAVRTAHQPGAENAPLYFLSANLFSKDVTRVYDELEMPVWMSHGVRGDFVDYRGAAAMKAHVNWRFDIFKTGAMPFFEIPEKFFAAYDAFMKS